jgi:hypothetical protein
MSVHFARCAADEVGAFRVAECIICMRAIDTQRREGSWCKVHHCFNGSTQWNLSQRSKEEKRISTGYNNNNNNNNNNRAHVPHAQLSCSPPRSPSLSDSDPTLASFVDASSFTSRHKPRESCPTRRPCSRTRSAVSLARRSPYALLQPVPLTVHPLRDCQIADVEEKARRDVARSTADADAHRRERDAAAATAHAAQRDAHAARVDAESTRSRADQAEQAVRTLSSLPARHAFDRPRSLPMRAR